MFMWIAIIALIFNISTWVISLAFRDSYYSEASRVEMKAYLILRGCFWIGIVVMFVFFLLAVKYE